MAAGEPKTVQACQPLVSTPSSSPTTPPKANLVKLSGNFLIAAVIETLGEAFAPVSKAGIDRARYLDILTNTLFGAPVYPLYPRLLTFRLAGYALPGQSLLL